MAQPTFDLASPPLIIDRPDLQSRRMRVVYTLLTSVMWGLWTYLWLPLVSLIAWALGARLFVVEMMLPDNLDYLYDLLAYAEVALIALLIILAWSRYNIARFRGQDRRRGAQPLTAADQAAYHGIDLELITSLRTARIATAEYDCEDRLVHVETSTGLPSTTATATHGEARTVKSECPA